MDAEQFDRVARVVGGGMARRRLIVGLLGATLAGALGRATVGAKGQQSRRRRHGLTAQRGSKPKPDGAKCTKDAQCLSGNCVRAGRKSGVCGPSCSCEGKTCGEDDGCGGTCQGSCANGLTCCRGSCTSLGTPVDCRSCDDTCTVLNGECTDGICDRERGCVSRPIREGEPCQGNQGTCQNGQCELACVPSNAFCLGPGRTCCDPDHVCGDDACGNTSACHGILGASCSVDCDCLFFLVCHPESRTCVETL